MLSKGFGTEAVPACPTGGPMPRHVGIRPPRHGSFGRWVTVACGAAALLTAQPLKAEPASPPLAAGTPAASEAEDPCDGLLAILDRPTVADSTCVVKPGRLIAELGYQNAVIKGSDIGHLAFFPQAEFRYGLPEGWELKLFPPNYNMTDMRVSASGGHVDGFGDSAFGLKHQFGTFGGFTLTADVKLTVPTGNQAFSDGGVEGNIQGIVSYDLTPKLGVSVSLGASTLTNRAANGGLVRFGSLNPDLVVTYQINDQLQLYSEVFGNTVTAPHMGPNFSFDGGVQYLLTKSIELDVEGGTLLTGPQGLQARYFGVGTGLLF